MNEVIETASSSPTLWVVGGIVGAVLLYMVIKRFGNRKSGSGGGGGTSSPGDPKKRQN